MTHNAGNDPLTHPMLGWTHVKGLITVKVDDEEKVQVHAGAQSLIICEQGRRYWQSRACPAGSVLLSMWRHSPSSSSAGKWEHMAVLGLFRRLRCVPRDSFPKYRQHQAPHRCEQPVKTEQQWIPADVLGKSRTWQTFHPPGTICIFQTLVQEWNCTLATSGSQFSEAITFNLPTWALLTCPVNLIN